MKAKEENMARRVRPYKIPSTGKLIDDAGGGEEGDKEWRFTSGYVYPCSHSESPLRLPPHGRIGVCPLEPRGASTENPTAETAMSIHPQIIEKDGRKELVVLPYEEFLQMQAEIEDYEDLRTLRDEKSTAHAQPARSLDDVLREVGN